MKSSSFSLGSVVPLTLFGEKKNDLICFLRTFFTTEASTGREPPKKGRRGKRENGYNSHLKHVQ